MLPRAIMRQTIFLYVGLTVLLSVVTLFFTQSRLYSSAAVLVAMLISFLPTYLFHVILNAKKKISPVDRVKRLYWGEAVKLICLTLGLGGAFYYYQQEAHYILLLFVAFESMRCFQWLFGLKQGW